MSAAAKNKLMTKAHRQSASHGGGAYLSSGDNNHSSATPVTKLPSTGGPKKVDSTHLPEINQKVSPFKGGPSPTGAVGEPAFITPVVAPQ